MIERRRQTRCCTQWGGFDGAKFGVRTLAIKERLFAIRRFVRKSRENVVLEIGNIVSVDHEVDQDKLALTHISTELSWIIAELTAEREQLEQAIVRVNAAAV